MDGTIKKILEPVSIETQGVCGTCRFYQAAKDYPSLSVCHAVSEYAHRARNGECNHGKLWDPIPRKPKPPSAFWQWLTRHPKEKP